MQFVGQIVLNLSDKSKDKLKMSDKSKYDFRVDSRLLNLAREQAKKKGLKLPTYLSELIENDLNSKMVGSTKIVSASKQVQPVAKNTDPIKQAKKFIEKAVSKPFDNSRFSKTAMSARAKH